MTLNRLKAVIFDFNGVIVDDEPLHLELFRRVLAEEGLELTDEAYRQKYLGLDDRGCFIASFADIGDEDLSRDPDRVNQLIARKAGYYLDAIKNDCRLFPGAADLIRRLQSDFPLAIASGALREEIEVVLQSSGLRDYFQIIVAAEDVAVCKPDPEGYLKALALLGAPIQNDECLVIEDSIAGVQAAKRAGMRCLAVTNSYRAEELSHADWIVGSLDGWDPQNIFNT